MSTIISIDFMHELQKFCKLVHTEIISILAASNMPIPDTSGRKDSITLARKTQRKITNSTHYEAREDGKIIGRVYHNTFTIGSEEDYVKIYFTGLFYMRDMPSDCMRLLIHMLPHSRYAEPPDSNMGDYSLAIILYPKLKRDIAIAMDCKVGTISNLLTELVYGGVLIRVAPSVYRLNPHLFGRGSVKDMGEMRALYPAPVSEATFMSVYKYNKALKKAQKEGLLPNPNEPDNISATEPDPSVTQ